MTTKKRPKKRTPSQPRLAERRRFVALREVLDELISFVRQVSRNAPTMSEEELEYAQQRLEWLADEVWRLVLEGGEP